MHSLVMHRNVYYIHIIYIYDMYICVYLNIGRMLHTGSQNENNIGLYILYILYYRYIYIDTT